MTRLCHSPLAAGLAALAITAAATAGELGPPAAQAATSGPHLLSCAGRSLIRPQGDVVLACGDANLAINGTRWSSWTASSASGTTTLEINLCKPTCVQSKMSSFHGSAVRLSGVKRSATGPVFSRATITYKNAGREATITAYPRT